MLQNINRSAVYLISASAVSFHQISCSFGRVTLPKLHAICCRP